jgi:hypothetical protein
MALNALAAWEDLNDTYCAIAYGLISTIHNCKVLHSITITKLTKDYDHLCHKVGKLTIDLKDKRDNIEMPKGFKQNAGHVNTQIPITGGYCNAKWV